jgi:hypothetical protein
MLICIVIDVLLHPHLLSQQQVPPPPACCPGKDDLLARADALNLPKNPLDDIIQRLGGPSKVAEMTGRKHRLVMQEDGTYLYQARAENSDCAAEKVRSREAESRVMLVVVVPGKGAHLEVVWNLQEQLHLPAP